MRRRACSTASLRWTFYYPQRYATDEQLAHEARAGTHFIETLRGMMAIKLNLREAERALGLPEPGGRPDQRRRAGAERGASCSAPANVLIFGLENVIVIWLGAYRW